MAKALRRLSPLFGATYEMGQEIPQEIIAKMTPQSLRALVQSHSIEVEGMAPSHQAGADQHLRARVDKHGEIVKKLEAGHAELKAENAALLKRLDALDGGANKAPAAAKPKGKKG